MLSKVLIAMLFAVCSLPVWAACDATYGCVWAYDSSDQNGCDPGADQCTAAWGQTDESAAQNLCNAMANNAALMAENYRTSWIFFHIACRATGTSVTIYPQPPNSADGDGQCTIGCASGTGNGNGLYSIYRQSSGSKSNSNPGSLAVNQSYTPTLTFSGGGSGDTETIKSASWQEVSGEVTLDGQITFSSLGTRSGGITFGLPAIPDAPANTTLTGSGIASVDGNQWNALVASGGMQLFNATNQQLTVASLTNTSSIAYHIQYASAPSAITWTPILSVGSGACTDYTTQSGSYTLITSKEVKVHAAIQLHSLIGCGTGNATLNLPVPDNTSVAPCSGGGTVTEYWYMTSINGTPVINVCNGYAYIFQPASNGTSDTYLTGSNLNINSVLDVTFSYLKQ